MPTDSITALVWMLAVWRTTHLLHAEDGPWDLFERVRRAMARVGADRAFACFYCLSLWVALPPAMWVAADVPSAIGLWLGFSGAACLAERATTRAMPAPAWSESTAPLGTTTPEGEPS